MSSAQQRQQAYQSVLDREGLQVRAPLAEEYLQILTPEAWSFVAELSRTFDGRRRELLVRRSERQREFDRGKLPDFLEETRKVREADWTVAPIPADLLDRRVEITGPTDRKMLINALNSGARVYMADFEDANSPTWDNMVRGQLNLRDAVDRSITYTSPEGKRYELAQRTATLMVRPRGWHLPEKHVWLNGAPLPGALFDFGLYFFHNARRLIERGTGPYFYLPKLESHLEARLWNDVFVFAQDRLGIPRGTIRATVLVETLPAAFEMDEILWELRDHSAGLNCGRWDYIFSFIKTLKEHPEYVLPDRGQVTMDRHFLRSYAELAIQTCHRRGVHAMGGMAAYIPVKTDPEANERALEQVRQDKLREVQAGHDGTWVAHPGLVPVALEVFDAHMPGPNQIGEKPRHDVHVTAQDLLAVPEGTITAQGLRHNIRVGIQYLEAWLGGSGSVPLYNLMEDAATAEISRTQVWQWVRHRARLDSGEEVTPALVQHTTVEEMGRIRQEVGPARFETGNFRKAAEIFTQMTTDRGLPLFLTLSAYDQLD